MQGDVIVAGAGPTGLALACGLRAAGIDVRVLDKTAGPAVTSRALGLQPRGVEVLDRLGALGDLPDRGLRIRSVTINVDGCELASFPVGQPTRLGGPRGLLMSQADIEGALRDRLTALDGDVEWGRGIQGLQPRPDSVTVRLDDGAVVDAVWVVGANGAHSVVRKAMGAFPRPGDDLWRVMARAPTGVGDERSAEAMVDYLGARLADEADGTIRS